MEIKKDFTHGGNIHKAQKELGISKKNIVDFSANINPLGLSPKGKRAIKRGIKNILNYPDPEYKDLKNAISNYYKVDNNYCTLGNGAIELIYSYIRSKKRGRALIPAPGFVEYEKALVNSNWKISYYKTKQDIDLTSIDVIFVCNPNNPTGESYSEDFLLQLLKKSIKNNIDIFLDEAFIEYSSYPSMCKYLKEYDNLYILKSLTKFFAIPGLRLGAVLNSNSNYLSNFNNNAIPWRINSVAEDYIKSALKDIKYISKSKKYIKRERVWFYTQLKMLKRIQVFKSQGNFLLFKTDLEVIDILKKEGILIRCCSNYNNLDKTYFRVAIKSRRDNLIILKKLNIALDK